MKNILKNKKTKAMQLNGKCLIGIVLFLFQIGFVNAQEIKQYAGPVLFDQSTNTSSQSDYSNIYYNLETNADTLYGDGPSNGIGNSLITADDFIVPSGETWNITSIYIKGKEEVDTNKIAGVHIQILNNNNGKPGSVISSFPFISDYIESAGNFVAFLPEAVSLGEGNYWVAFAVISDRNSQFTWRWYLESNTEILGNYASYYYAYSENSNANSEWILNNLRGSNKSFSVHGSATNDVGIIKITNPGSSESMGSEDITVQIRNFGTVAQSNFKVQYKIDDLAIVEETVASTIDAGETLNYTFATQGNFSEVKTYNLWASTVLTGDEVPENDSTSKEIQNFGTIYKISDYHNQTISTCSGKFTDAGGVNGDIAADGAEYIMTIKSDGEFKKVQLDFTEFQLTYKSSLTIYDGESTSDDQLFYGAFLSGPSAPVVATNATGALTIKFTSFEGIYANNEGWIANISCVTVPNYDLTISDIVAPVNDDNMGIAEEVTFAIKNLGKYTETGFNVGFSIVEAGQVFPTNVTETVTQDVLPGEILNYTFVTKIDLSEAGDYEIKANVNLDTDNISDNDTLVATFTNHGKVFRINNYNGQEITTCEGRFTDEGGIDDGTSPGEYSTTLKSGSSTSRIALDFNQFRINADGDTLFIYDGLDASAPLIGQWSGAANLGEIKATSGTGALTVKYIGTNAISQQGWEADISCHDAYANDMGISKLFNPLSGEDLLTNEAIKVMVKNYGYNPQSNVDVSYTVYVSDTIYDSFSETLSHNFANGGEIEHTFTKTTDLAERNTYKISVKATITNDDFTDNDSSIYMIESYGKVYRISDFADSEIVACSGTFADEGGLVANYPKETAYKTTLKPSEAGKRTRLFFNSFYIGWDGLFTIYDGEDSSAPKIGSWAYGKLEGEIKAKNTTGALTIEFDGPAAYEGWDAEISCYEPIANDFALLDVFVENEPAMVNEPNNIVVNLHNYGSLNQAKDVTLNINGVDIESLSTGNIEGGALTSISFQWTPTQAKVDTIRISIPDDQGDENNDTIISKVIAYDKGSLFESFEGEIFPPEFWYQTNENWGQGTITEIYLDTVPDGNFVATVGGLNEFDLDTLVTPLLEIKAGDVIRLKAMRYGGWLSYGWVNGETGEFTSIDTNMNYTPYIFEEHLLDISEAAGINRIAFIGLPTFSIDKVWGPKMHLPNVNMQAIEIASLPTAVLESPAEISVVMRNMGALAVESTDYSVTIYQKGTPDYPLKTVAGIYLESLQLDTLKIPVDFIFEGQTEVYAQINIANDFDSLNNETDLITIDVYKKGSVIVEVGDGDENNYKIPMAMAAPYSVTQVIYNANQIGNVGYIGGISYENSFLENQNDVNVEIYMALTNSSSFNGEWLPTASFTKVFDSKVDFKAGDDNLYLSLEIPFRYSGGNLAVMVYKYAADVYYDQVFKQSITENLVANTITASTAIDINNMGLGIAKKLVPNTKFYINSLAAIVSGTINDSYGLPIERASIELIGESTVSQLSNAKGEFIFDNVLANHYYDIKITAIGHESVILNKVLIDSLNYSIGKQVLQVIEMPFAVIAEKSSEKNIISWKHETEGTYEAPFLINSTIETVYSASANKNVWAGNKIEVHTPGTVVGAFIWAVDANGGGTNDAVTLEMLDKSYRTLAKSEEFHLPNQQEIFVELPYVSYNEEFYLMVHWENLDGLTYSIGVDIDGPKNLGYIGNNEAGYTPIDGTFTVQPALLNDYNKKDTKGFLGYDLFRGLKDSMSVMSGWEKVNNVPISPINNSVTYYDYNWIPDQIGEYMYAVRSLYERDSSTYVYSNLLTYGTETHVTVELTTNGGSPEGAIVSLINNNNLGVNTYTQVIDSASKAIIPNVLRGTYSIKVEHDAYDKVNLQDYTFNTDFDTLSMELNEIVVVPFDVKAEVNNQNQSALISWNGYGDTTQIILDDASFENGLIIGADDILSLGNKYETNFSGSIVGVDIFGLEYGDGTELYVRAEIYSMGGEKLGTSQLFIIPANDFITVNFNKAIDFAGDFYAMVSWNNVGGVSNILAMDMNGENAGKSLSYVFSESSGFFPLSDVNTELDGVFAIRPSIVVSGLNLKSGANNLTIKGSKPVGLEFATLGETSINASGERKGVKGFGSFNIYLNDMLNPYAENISELHYELNNLELGAHEVGVSAIYGSGETEIIKTTFNVSVGIDNELKSLYSVYPNPSSGVFYINETNISEIEIYSINGEWVSTISMNPLSQKVDLSYLNSGVYFMQINNDTNQQMIKIVINK